MNYNSFIKNYFKNQNYVLNINITCISNDY